MLHRRAGKLRWGGMDLAAHCINDVLCSGAEPLFFLDYVAADRIELEQVADLVEGAAEVCRAAGCMLIGGETAELPGVYQDDELDFAGTCVGIVERARLVDGSRCEAGNASSAFRRADCTRRFLARALARRRTTTSTPTCCSRRIASTSTRCGSCERRGRPRTCARDRRRDPRQPLARVAGRAAGTDRLGRVGATTGLPWLAERVSGRTSCGASSTSGSAIARSSPSRLQARS